VKSFTPKLFDKEDDQSSYNQKFREKLNKSKLRRIKSITLRNLAADSKAQEDSTRARMTNLDKAKKKKLGELMRHIQEQQEEIKKEGTRNYATPTRVKNKRQRMAGGKMESSTN